MTPSNRKTLALSLLCAALSLGAWQSASAAAPKDTLMIDKFDDGAEVDANAVKFSFDRVMQLKQGPSGAFPDDMKVTVVDPLTVRFTLAKPYAPFLYTLAHNGAGIINPDVVKQGDVNAYLSTHTAGSGAFRLSNWQKGQSLTLEPNTVFWNQPPVLPEDDTLWDIQEAGQALLAEHGYAQYEVSAYAQPGRPARHNLNYWSFGDFIGIGAGAHGKLSHPDGRIVRTWKTRAPKDYLNPAKNYQAGAKELTNEELPFEFLMNALRLTDGVEARLYAERTGLELASLDEARREAEQSGLMQVEPSRLAATDRGQLFLNDLLQKFLS